MFRILGVDHPIVGGEFTAEQIAVAKIGAIFPLLDAGIAAAIAVQPSRLGERLTVGKIDELENFVVEENGRFLVTIAVLPRRLCERVDKSRDFRGGLVRGETIRKIQH